MVKMWAGKRLFDVTGTLTEGKMTMVKMWAGKRLFDVTGKGFDPTIGGFKFEDTQGDANAEVSVRSTIFAGWLCSNCKIVKGKDEGTGSTVWKPWGNSSEAPITTAAGKLKFWVKRPIFELKCCFRVFYGAILHSCAGRAVTHHVFFCGCSVLQRPYVAC